MSQKIKQGLRVGAVIKGFNNVVDRLAAREAQSGAGIAENFRFKSSWLGGAVGSHSGSNQSDFR